MLFASKQSLYSIVVRLQLQITMNNQQVDRIISFYRINHDFHEPYQLLLDGNFIKLLVEKDIDIKRKFQNASSGRVSIRITSCILRELELLGQEFKFVLERARTFKPILCKHSLEMAADRCILEQIGEENPRKNIVCSQDIELRRYLRDLEIVPIVYFGPDQRITMEDINKRSLKNLERQQQQKFLPRANEQKELEELRRQEQKMEKKKHIKELSSQFGIQVKTKVVKGPNPLSVKRKRIPLPDRPAVAVQDAPKKKRIRKRNKNNQQTNSQNE